MKLEPMRTTIRVQYKKIKREKGSLAEDTIEWIDVGNESEKDKPIYRHCAWKNVYGSELTENSTSMTKHPAKIRMRYDPRIDATCRVLKNGEKMPYEIISSPDNINDCSQLMEFRVQRMEGA